MYLRLARTALLLLSTATALGLPKSSFAEDYTFRMAFQTGAPDTPVYVTGAKFKEAIERKSGGRVKINLFPGGVLGDQIALVSGVRTGSIDMAIMVAWSLATVEPSCLLPELPFLFDDLESARKVLDGPAGQKIFSISKLRISRAWHGVSLVCAV